MNREEKRVIRKEISGLLDSCNGCQYRIGNGEVPVHCSTVCPSGITMQKLAAQLISDETIKTSQKVVAISIPVIVGPWSSDEEFYLLNHLNLYKVAHLSQRLNRAPKSVSAKASYLRRKYPDMIGW
ncbi:MAG: hypothetical protein K0R18_548 [Bacillales bacterium]|jgi:hypothetical protein|nr:hypothetical protein [Bacillales bacterium]